MIKALNRIFKQDKEKLTIPKSVQQVIPVKRIWLDGIWQVGNKYSRCWKILCANIPWQNWNMCTGMKNLIA